MKLVKNLVLIVAAIFAVKALVTAIGLLLSIAPMIYDLPSNEASRRMTYEILVGYFSVMAVLSVLICMSIFNNLVMKKTSKLNIVFFGVLGCLSSAHLLVAIVGEPDKFLLAQFAQTFIWFPILAIFAALISFVVTRKVS